MAAADPAAVGPGAYAETVLAAADLVARIPGDDPARTTIARQLVALGLPDPALATARPGAGAGRRGRSSGRGRGELQPRGSRRRRARRSAGWPARPRPGSGPAPSRSPAPTTGRRRRWPDGMTVEAGAYAWPSGDWAAAARRGGGRSRAAGDGLLHDACGPGPPRCRPPPRTRWPSTPRRRSRNPLPPLDRPSLGAARRLLDTGDQIGGFVQGVLDEE